MMNVRRAATTGTLREHRRREPVLSDYSREGTQCGKFVGVAALITIFVILFVIMWIRLLLMHLPLLKM
jgi:hypothetical protein